MTYSKYIDPYINKILNNEIEHCNEQELMINNIIIPTLEREDVYIDEKHEYVDVANMNTLTSGLGKVRHGIRITITTNGHVRGGVLDRELDQAKDIIIL